ncbi:microtubule-actin cross-linking factor 1-like [Diadema antillarum]|uniref:microtubule-actin cross-linking factor 1-like n=1 Tax=Diadema antillarum TaxID=105358 RepID=UPI003A888ED4
MQLMHEDIEAHQQPILHCVEEIEQLIKTWGDRIGPGKSKQVQDGLSELRGRYDTVVMQSSNRQKTLTRAFEELEKVETVLEKELREKSTKLQNLQDWLAETEQVLTSEQRPEKTSDLVKQQLKKHQLMHEDIEAHQQPILHCVEDIEQLIKTWGDRIGPGKSKQLQDGLSELRGRYDTVVMQSSNRQKTLTRAMGELEKLEMDLEKELREKSTKLQNLQDWLAEAEQVLTSKQPAEKTSDQVKQQLNKHQLMHEDIEAHQQPILQCVEGMKQLLETQENKIGPRKSKLLRDGQSELRDRYETVVMQSSNCQKTLTRAIEKLEKLEEISTKLQNLQDWLAETEQVLTSEQPPEKTSDLVKQQLNKHQLMHEDIEAHQQPILQCVEDIEQLLKTWGDRIGPGKNKQLQDGLPELRGRYETVVMQSSNRQKTLTRAIEKLEKLEMDLEMELQEISTKLQNLQDWLAETEQVLTSEQPPEKTSDLVKQQLNKHHMLHEDIGAHQQQILQCVEDIEQLIKTWGDRIGPGKSKQLQDGLSELRGRYDTVVMQSSNRQKTLTRAIEELEKLEDLVTHLGNHKKTVDVSLRNEQFVADNKENLHNDKQDELNQQVAGLKEDYNKLQVTVQYWLKNAQDELNRLRQKMNKQVAGIGIAHLLLFVMSIPARLQLYSEHVRRHKLMIIRMAVTTAVLISALCLAARRTQHHFEAGARGTVTFDAPWTPNDGLVIYFNLRFESERHPFCTLTNRHREGFKSLSQYDRFKISYTLTDSTVRVTVEISDISEEDADVYILTLSSISNEYSRAVLLEKEVKVHQPRGSAQCDVHESTDGYSGRYAEVSCRAVAGTGSPMLACYQHGEKVPYKGQCGRYPA